ncbi:FAD-binding oxidoreductase [Pseudomonas fragi]|uniref:FAD-binding oxidoreductase n=1 Tax=Pseudomonas fragi TaxID=296 RepID=UPI0002DDAB33|nr:FAD-binding oxidoreductase [Pseudomonas fragi]MDE4515442.1 FAD-binding oxidoreductase [Pseudomonas fragi]QPC35317.1 FAD-binding oxidoreductase [Pseudomonas fragi]SDU56783.1 FAD/FMN-containing dehydrogenase [Pseudomonas fragi]
MSNLEPASGLHAFLTEVAEVLGQESLLTGAACAPYEIDVTHYRGKAAAVVLPRDTHAVSALMRIAVRHRIRLVAQGNRSGLVGGAVTDNSGTQVIVSLSRLRRVREIDPLNRTVIVEAGALLSELNRQLETHSLYFPIDIGSDPAIGGLIGANAGGSRLLKHGDMRHNLLGIEVVLADGDGTVVQLLAPLRKNNTGLDLKQMFVGTGGAFGIITAATLDLRRIDQSTQSVFVALPDHATALQVLDAFEHQFGDLLCAFEVISEAALALTVRNFPTLRHPFGQSQASCYALIEIASSMPGLHTIFAQRTEQVLEQLYESGRILDAVLGNASSFWPLRDNLPLAIAQEGIPLSFDVAFSRSRLVAFRDLAAQWLEHEHPLLQLYDFGHFADGGCHLIVLVPHAHIARYGIAKLVAVRSGLYKLVSENGGCFSAEHGVGPMNAAYYSKYTPPGVQAISRAMQQLMDPQAVLGRYRYT